MTQLDKHYQYNLAIELATQSGTAESSGRKMAIGRRSGIIQSSCSFQKRFDKLVSTMVVDKPATVQASCIVTDCY